MPQELAPGVYNLDYFSGAQVAMYIGDILIDEVTSIQFSVTQSKKPLYGYADQLFRDMSKGQILVQGQFTINFKEAGYLWLVLQTYQDKIGNLKRKTPFFKTKDKQGNFESISKANIERIINNDTSSIDQRTGTFIDLSDLAANFQGFSGRPGVNKVGQAEAILEQFEDTIWGDNPGIIPEEPNRRADDSSINGFDIYLAYGDFAGDNRANHTIRKIENVHIFGTSQVVQIDGQVLQESYSFYARNLV